MSAMLTPKFDLRCCIGYAYRAADDWNCGGMGRLCPADAMARVGPVRRWRFFARTAQTGRFRGTVAPGCCAAAAVGPVQVNFLFGLYDLLSADLHCLYPNHFVAHDAHEIDILRRFAIDPIFVLRTLIIFLANLLSGRPLE